MTEQNREGLTIPPSLAAGVIVLLLLFIGAMIWIQHQTMCPPRSMVNETNANSMLKSYCTAQFIYKQNRYSPWNGSAEDTWLYAPSWQALGGATAYLKANGQRLTLIPDLVAAADAPATAYQGYYYCDIKTMAGREMDTEMEFALCAVPAIYGRTGRMTLIINHVGQVFGKDRGEGTPITDWPADLESEGWRPVP
ncbi:MAG: DUF2950 family protein [Planctomycetota bacterium]|jgi:hypothetical protein